jgi:phenylpropionate dioxygenase-like ring-hydroxylating dioxygenase large terminal subunit
MQVEPDPQRVSPLTPAHYFSPEVHALEQQRVFRRFWIFAGFTSLLREDDAFVTRRIGDVPIVIQNFGGRLKAFENICAHRQMALQWNFAGRRPLVCRYHGWGYDVSGQAQVPQADTLYAFAPEQRGKVRLREIALAQVGGFVFVNLSETPHALQEQFEPAFLEGLKDVSSHFDSEIIHTRVAAAYNWKLGFENVIDANHVPYLHESTFARNLPAPRPAPRARGRPSLRDLSWHQASRFAELKPADWRDRIAPYGDEPLYHNWFVYPNVNFVSVGGYSFALQQFNPIAADRTEILLMLFLATRRDALDFSPAVLWHNLQAEKRVLDEDIGALERLQAGLHAGARPAILGAHESRVAALLEWHAGLLR